MSIPVKFARLTYLLNKKMGSFNQMLNYQDIEKKIKAGWIIEEIETVDQDIKIILRKEDIKPEEQIKETIKKI